MSSSPEIEDSCSFSGQNLPVKAPVKSSFSRTCNLFSQYLKENNTFPDLTLGRRAPPAATMNLFSMVETPRGTVDQQPAAPKQQDQSRTMTIFYNGQVLVFDDLAPEKLKEIMKLAEQGAALKAPKPEERSKNIVVSASGLMQNYNRAGGLTRSSLSIPLGRGLPIARRNSIASFLKKRNNRITARSPYQAKDVSKQDDNKTWLGLGAESH